MVTRLSCDKVVMWLSCDGHMMCVFQLLREAKAEAEAKQNEVIIHYVTLCNLTMPNIFNPFVTGRRYPSGRPGSTELFGSL